VREREITTVFERTGRESDGANSYSKTFAVVDKKERLDGEYDGKGGG